MKDTMLDLETWGTRPGCAIRSIGACFFNADTIGNEFYVNVDRASCEAAGLHIDANTVQWWERQSKEAQAALLIDPQPLADALWSFNAWFTAHGGVRVWSHGAGFDSPIMEAAYYAVDMMSPWSFWDTRCTRTIYDIAGIDTRKAKRTGVHHNALDDAKFQTVCVQAAYRRITVGTAPPVIVAPPPHIVTRQPNSGDVFS